MTAETARDNLLPVLPDTEILARDPEGRVFRVRSIEVSAGGADPDSVILHLEGGH